MLKKILPLALWLTATISALGQNAVMVNRSNSIITYPLNFWTANALVGRSGLGFNTNLNTFWAATNAATARTAIGALATNGNGSAVTNLTAANITGTLAISNGGSGATTAGGARTNFGLGVTDSVSFSNIAASGYISIGNSAPLLKSEAAGIVGFYNNVNNEYILSIPNDTDDVIINAQWNNAGVRSNLGLGASWLTNTNVTNFRTAIGLGTTNTVAFDTIQIQSDIFTPALEASDGTNYVILTAAEISFQGVAGPQTRTNLGLGLSALTNTNTTSFRTAIGLGTTNKVSFDTVSAKESTGFSSTTLNGIQWQNMYPSSNGLIGLYGSDAEGTTTFGINIGTMSGTTVEVALFNSDRITFYEPLTFNNTTNAATTRTNLRLGWSALTNTNPAGFNTSLYGSGTNPVLYNTNGEVVSPTNFWQVAPIVTRFIESQPIASQTTNITAARNLHIHSIAISTTNVTNTIALPITNSFDGDIALIVHQGPTSSVTAVRTVGAATNLVTLNQFEQTVEFVFYDNVWQFNHNRSFIEPIFFSGTSAADHAAESRTNLGLGGGMTTNIDIKLNNNNGMRLHFTNGILTNAVTPIPP